MAAAKQQPQGHTLCVTLCAGVQPVRSPRHQVRAQAAPMCHRAAYRACTGACAKITHAGLKKKKTARRGSFLIN